MKKIYIISGYFPPQDTAAAKSFFKLVYPFCNDSDFDIKIFTCGPQMYRKVDNSISEFIQAFDIEYINWKGQLLFKIMNRLLVLYNDVYAPFAITLKRRFLKVPYADIYILRGTQFSTFLLAPFINAKLQRPVILFYSDPLLDNPYGNYSSRLKKRIELMERNALDASSGVIFVNKQIQDKTSKRYPSININSVVIPHVYSKILLEKATPKKEPHRKCVTFTYAGHFYGNRQPFPLFRAISNLKKENNSKISNFRFQLIGLDKTSYKQKIEEYENTITELDIQNEVTLVGRLDYLETLKHLSGSDVLVNIDAPAGNGDSLFLPSKLIDYLGTRRPIWTLSPKGPAASLVSDFGGIVSDPNDIGMIANDLVRCIKRTIKDEWSLNFDLVEKFESNNIYPSLKTFLNKIINQS